MVFEFTLISPALDKNHFQDALEEPGVLGQYSMIMLTEPDVPTKGMVGLLEWVNAGGMLVTVSGAGSGDEYNTPSTALSAAAKVTEAVRKRLVFAGDDTLPAGTTGTVTLGDEKLTFTAPSGSFGGLTPTSSDVNVKTLGTFTDGTPAVTRTTVQKGSIVRFGWLPGVSYWFSHTPGSIGNRPRSDSIRRIIAKLATAYCAH